MEERNFKRTFINPMRFISNRMGLEGEAVIEHITYNPNLTKRNGAQFERRLYQRHDGTMIFTAQLISELLAPVLNMQSCPKEHEARMDMVRVEYEIGDIRLATVFHIEDGIEINGNKMPGQREKATMPVKCTIFLKDGKILT